MVAMDAEDVRDKEPAQSTCTEGNSPRLRSWNEAETRTITAVSADMRTVSFTTGLAYLHYGSTLSKTRSTDGKSWTADLRAEVGLLSRNVKI